MKKTFILLLTIVSLIVGCKPSKNLTNSDLQLVWSDEFDYEGLPNLKKWTYDVGTACDKPAGCGWGNNELQYYTENRFENARVEDGMLIIEAIKEPYKENRAYTSARLVSLKKGDWKYGRIEVMAKLPSGTGTWPAIWMLPSEWKYGGWPESGEIDIMEHVGYAPDTVFANIHTKAYNYFSGVLKGGEIYSPNSEKAFQEYAIEWNAKKIDWFIDGVKYHTFQNEKSDFKAWPFDQDFHLILNLAVGGHWGGKHGIDEAIWPQRLEIEYVRVYQERAIAD